MRNGEELEPRVFHFPDQSMESSGLDTSQADLTPTISQPTATDKVCRICLETTEETLNRLIHPCRCAGSVRYVHEECLKAWLASQIEDMTHAQCELCKTPFEMTIKVARKCSAKEACNEGFTQCLFVPLLLAVLGMLVLIIYLLSDKYLVNASSGQQRGYTAALVATCIITGVVISYLLFRALREACCSRKLAYWSIADFDVSSEEEPPVVTETKITTSVEIPMHIDVRSDPLEDGIDPLPPVMILPKRLNFGGMKVKMPSLHSGSLTPVNKRGRVVAVTPRLVAASLSQSRASLNVTPKSQLALYTPNLRSDLSIRPITQIHRFTPTHMLSTPQPNGRERSESTIRLQ